MEPGQTSTQMACCTFFVSLRNQRHEALVSYQDLKFAEGDVYLPQRGKCAVLADCWQAEGNDGGR